MKNLPLTEKQIFNVVKLLTSWECLTHLTGNEKDVIFIELKNIAGTALMEANNQIQNILPNLYKQTT